MPSKGHSITTLKNRTTGRYAGRIEIEYGSGHNDPIDEVPPVGFTSDVLTITPPRRLAGVSAAQLKQGAERGGPSTQAAHIAEALEKKEK